MGGSYGSYNDYSQLHFNKDGDTWRMRDIAYTLRGLRNKLICVARSD